MDSLGDTEKALKKILGTWPDGTALLWACLLYLIIAKFTIPDGLPLTLHVSFLFTPLLIITVTWSWARRVPKTRRNKLGFGVAINFETQEVRSKVEHDFVDELRLLIGKGETGKWFELIQFKSHISRSLISDDSARALRDKARLSFLMFGSAKIRHVNSTENNVIKLRGLVSHSPIPSNVQTTLQKEFSELFFPERVLIPEENDLFAFEFTSQWANIVARYIVGIALLVSNQFDAAQTIFEDLQNLLENTRKHAQPVVKIKSRLSQRLAEVHLSRALSAYHLWKNDKTEFSHIRRIAEQIDGINVEDLITPQLLFLRSLCYFLLDGNTKLARNELNQIKGSRDSVWYYNMGFLYAYDGSMKKATHMYSQGALYEMQGDLITELESFMCWVLENDPGKFQIHYCLGLLNQNLKADNIQAKKDYDLFLAKCTGNQFAVYQRRARAFIEDQC